MDRATFFYAVIFSIVVFAGCNHPTPVTQSALQQYSNGKLTDEQIQEAFQLPQMDQQREGMILTAVEAFLRDETVRHLDDAEASMLLTNLAFSSGNLVFDDPAFIHRQGTLVVVGIPDGTGLFLYDLVNRQGVPPVSISHWTAGLNSVDVIWADREIGVSYLTVDGNGAAYAHYAGLSKEENEWRVLWFSDDVPDWWFNARNATVSVAPYLSRLTVVGEAASSTLIFDETGDVPHRLFKIEWLRDQHYYKSTPPVGSAQNRQAWLWKIAQPSAYATLVEFMERIQSRNTQGIDELSANPSVLSSAMSYGLQQPGTTYRVTAYTENRIVFQGQQGAFVATFEVNGDLWLLAGLQPLGAEVKPSPLSICSTCQRTNQWYSY